MNVWKKSDGFLLYIGQNQQTYFLLDHFGASSYITASINFIEINTHSKS